MDSATQVYKLWAAENKLNKANGAKGLTPPTIEIEQNPSQEQKANLDIVEEQAISGINEFIKAKNLTNFQILLLLY